MPSDALPSDAWTLYEQLGEHDRSTLTEKQRMVLAICDLRQEVNAGGYDTYFRYWGGDTAPQALAALPGVLGQDWADLLHEAMQTLGPAYPSDPDARADLLDQRQLDDRLHDLDSRFYELEASVDADRRVDAYLAQGGA